MVGFLVLVQEVFNTSLYSSIPTGYLSVLFFGIKILLEYASNQAMGMGGAWTIAAGQYSEPIRVVGVLFGIAICGITIYGYFAGWNS